MLGSNLLGHPFLHSSVKSPVPKRPLVNHNFTGITPSPRSTSPLNGHYQSRVGEYHMSRQNPDILDQMYLSPSTANSTRFLGAGRGGIYTLGNRDRTTYMLGRVNGHRSPAISPRLGSVGAPAQLSYLRQILNSRRSQSVSPSSLVQLATRKGVGRTGRLLKNGVGGSPVIVRLAGANRSEKKEEVQQAQVVNRSESNNKAVDPCDKEVVLSALRQRRLDCLLWRVV